MRYVDLIADYIARRAKRGSCISFTAQKLFRHARVSPTKRDLAIVRSILAALERRGHVMKVRSGWRGKPPRYIMCRSCPDDSMMCFESSLLSEDREKVRETIARIVMEEIERKRSDQR